MGPTDCLAGASSRVLIRINCDEDGWGLKVNDEKPYDVFFHVTRVAEVSQIRFTGQAIVSYIGIGKGTTITSHTSHYLST